MGDEDDFREGLDPELTLRLLAEMPLREMNMKRSRLHNLVDQLNEKVLRHLLLLVLLPAHRPERNHWKGELTAWLLKIAIARVKSGGKAEKAKFYFDYLWADFYEDRESGLVALELQVEAVCYEYGVAGPVDLQAVATALRPFYRSFADRCGRGIPPAEARVLVRQLLDAVPTLAARPASGR